jgi:acetylornithine deacetylase/succinyl-diaminopimelate desuccinylase-like protein
MERSDGFPDRSEAKGQETLIRDSRVHSPDENMLIENFLGGMRMNRILLEELGKVG